MFKKNDPLVDSVKAVMEVSDFDRQIEAAVNEEFGVTSKNALPHELRGKYEERLAEAKKCMYEAKPLSPKQKEVMDVNKNNKIDSQDLKLKRAGLEQEETEQLNELKAKTLRSYVKKAEKQLDQGEAKDDYNRQLGVDRADYRLKKKSFGNMKDMHIDPEHAEWHKAKPYHFREEEQLDEKAVSKAQHRFFGLVRGIQKGKAHGSEKAEKAAKEMSTKEVRKFAKTKEKGLPEKVNEQALWEEIKSNLEEQLISVYESGDEAAFADFVSSLTEEQLMILELLPHFMGGSGTGIVSGIKNAATAVQQKVAGTAGTGADPRTSAPGAKSSIPTSGAERGDYNKPSHLAGGTGAQSQVAATTAPKAPDLSGGRQSVSTGKSVDQKGAMFQQRSNGKMVNQNPGAVSSKNPKAGQGTGPKAPATAAIKKPAPAAGGWSTTVTPATPAPGAAAAAAQKRGGYSTTKSGASAGDTFMQNFMREEIKPQIKESFEQFLRNKFLKG